MVVVGSEVVVREMVVVGSVVVVGSEVVVVAMVFVGCEVVIYILTSKYFIGFIPCRASSSVCDVISVRYSGGGQAASSCVTASSVTR